MNRECGIMRSINSFYLFTLLSTISIRQDEFFLHESVAYHLLFVVNLSSFFKTLHCVIKCALIELIGIRRGEILIIHNKSELQCSTTRSFSHVELPQRHTCHQVMRATWVLFAHMLQYTCQSQSSFPVRSDHRAVLISVS